MKTSFAAILAAGCLSLLAGSPSVSAQPTEYPTRPIRLITPFPPGGGTDAVARIVGDKLAELLKQPVVVENKGGAGGSLGTEIAARAEPDGYTLVLGSSATHAVNPSLYSKLSYDPIEDFAPISTVATTPLLLMVNASTPANNIAELIALSKKSNESNSLTYASAGVGSAQHLGAELFKSMAGATILHVPYKGAGPAMVDLLAGHVDMAFDTMPSALQQIKSDKLKVLGVSSPARNATLPNVPVIAETVPGYEMVTWYGLFAPAGTPPAIIKTLNDAVKRVLDSKGVKEKFKTAGIEPYWSSSADFAALLKREIPKWREVIKQSGATID
ncbi:tripartite tricarboxylate transporter substrate binding protein [Pusillimonas sp. SM2304]|uniref:Bug family tripartite tricarboxylate transporter substrate binding protein n=1 Tax=Pusillimonas sp. SM2304 TaxID=3073241 RepID=UPI0028766C3C|nr:tripartite tricarboxylate transporter substrate binding protein [Pusillimonas sp. SM2304]MDS1138967.1 tripartite tricarboxylate transporter substrate binding protein [Pusillimonas sp. SM2304]